MTATPAPKTPHEGKIYSDMEGDFADCSCGWHGPVRGSFEEASKDLLAHMDQVSL